MPRLIDADALYKMLSLEADDYMDLGRFERARGLESALCAIEYAPTVQYTPASESAWVKLTGMMPPEYCGRHECQHCGFIQNYHFREVLYPYCPRCGSKMKNGVSADDI